MATGRMTLEELVAKLDLSPVDEGHAFDSTLRPTLAPRIRKTAKPSVRPKPRTLKPPAADERTSHALRVKGPLAEGGMGTIQLAEQAALRRDVALKSLKDEFLSERFAERMRLEARILGLVEHPNIVPLYALETDERNAPVMVMKRIEGLPWRVFIQDPAHPAFPEDATDRLAWHLNVLMQVCDAVHYAHSRGMLHLDLKPDNVMVGSFREIYLVDWGVAVSTDPKYRGWLPLAEDVSEVLGTPAYLAPEMVDVGNRTLGPRTDVFLLGAVLYEILCGDPPHKGQTLQEILYSAYAAEEPKLPAMVSKELGQIVRKAMAPHAENRYASAEELRQAIQDFLDHRTSTWVADHAHTELTTLRRLIDSAATPHDPPVAKTSDTRNAQIQRVFGRCRFGFGEALRQWPDNPAALAGQRDSLLVMAEYHLHRGEAASAEILLEELPADEPEAVGLRQDAEQQREEAARLSMLGLEERDVGQQTRGMLMLAVVFFVIVLPMMGAFVLSRMDVYKFQWWHTLGYDILLAAFFGLGGFVGRSRASRRSRRMAVTIAMLALLVVVMRVFFIALGMLDIRSIALELSLFGCGCALAGVSVDRRFYVAVPALLFGAVLVLSFEQYAQLWVALAAVLGPGPLAWLWLKQKTSTSAESHASPKS